MFILVSWVIKSKKTYPVLFIFFLLLQILFWTFQSYCSNGEMYFALAYFFFNTEFFPKFTCTLLGRLRDDEEVLEALALVLDELAFCFGGNAGAPLGPTLNSPRISWTSRLVLLVSCRSPLSSVEVRSVKIPIWISKGVDWLILERTKAIRKTRRK